MKSLLYSGTRVFSVGLVVHRKVTGCFRDSNEKSESRFAFTEDLQRKIELKSENIFKATEVKRKNMELTITSFQVKKFTFSDTNLANVTKHTRAYLLMMSFWGLHWQSWGDKKTGWVNLTVSLRPRLHTEKSQIKNKTETGIEKLKGILIQDRLHKDIQFQSTESSGYSHGNDPRNYPNSYKWEDYNDLGARDNSVLKLCFSSHQRD